MKRRELETARIIEENGVTYNVHHDQQGAGRLWKMDLFPLLLTQEEQGQIEAALAQRARLLDRILHDFYGPQTLLREGLYPPQLVLGNPAFLRPCHRLLNPEEPFIYSYVADLARSPDGKWWVLSDRVDTPAGLGYAFENRYISTRVLPDIFRELNVLRLTQFVRRYCEGLGKASPRLNDEPFVVLLSPGPGSETYFEQLLIARTLGFALVEGADLTVRNNTVYLKSTEGIRRVDVILRRLGSDWCDPLELRSESLLGVPGLLNAIRHGNVRVVNSPGSGLLETPALMAFLPGICRHLLGEDLKMPSIATWWCGHEHARRTVLSRLSQLIIRPAFGPMMAGNSYYGSELTEADLTQLATQIERNPGDFIAQENVQQSTAPVLEKGQLISQPVTLRAFLTRQHDEPGDFAMMPGGLARVVLQENEPSLTMQTGGCSKDVWVVADQELDDQPISLTPPDHLKIRRAQEDLPSRVADNLYWLGRYVERAEALVRGLLVVHRVLRESISKETVDPVMPFLQGITGTRVVEEYRASQPDWNSFAVAEAVVTHFLWDEDEPSSLVTNLTHIERTAHVAKERISGNTTQILGNIPQDRKFLQSRPHHHLDENLYNYLIGMLESFAAFSGTVMENTTRGQDWHFLEIGRRIERGLKLCDLIESCLEKPSEHEVFLLTQLLDYADSTITYRRRYLTNIWLAGVIDLLLLDEANPRSLAFQVEALRRSIHELPHHVPGAHHPLDRRILAVYNLVWMTEPNPLAEIDEQKSARTALVEFLDQSGAGLGDLSDLVSKHYFSITAQSN